MTGLEHVVRRSKRDRGAIPGQGACQGANGRGGFGLCLQAACFSWRYLTDLYPVIETEHERSLPGNASPLLRLKGEQVLPEPPINQV